jgi:hypothetical protein
MPDNEGVLVTVTLSPYELLLFRRALAKAADAGEMDRKAALSRICQLDVLRWEAEERFTRKYPGCAYKESQAGVRHV